MKTSTESAKYGVISIATKGYIDYWKRMAISFDEQLTSGRSVVFHVYTDQPAKVFELSKELNFSDVCIHQIESLGWPEATLLRYAIFSGDWGDVSEEIVIYLDADMLARVDLTQRFDEHLHQSRINLVSHPGFYRPSNLLNRVVFYSMNPRFLVADLRMYLSIGGIGAWETRKISLAFVPRSKRKHYVCGGIWAGPNGLMKSLIQKLATNVETDMNNDVMARWHDESHLNWWASQESFNLLKPMFCHEKKYPQLKSLIPFVTAVDKHEK